MRTPPARPGVPAGASRGPRNGLGAATFVVVVLGAVLAVVPATAALGLLLCLGALVPAVIAFRRTRKGTATNGRRSVAAVLMAPAFLVVAFVVVGTTAAPRVQPASDAVALHPAPPAGPAVAPLVAAPAAAPAPVAVPEAAVDEPAPAASPGSPTTTTRATRRPVVAPAPHAAVRPPAPTVVRPAPPAPAVPVAPPVRAVTPKPKPAPAKPAPAAPACDESTHYVNSSGHCVPRPESAAAADGGATARCRDGKMSFSEHRAGTCSGHGGVAQWLRQVS